jgi:hypothetical protein
MHLVIKVDLDKTKQSLPEIFGLIANCGCADATEEATAGIGAPIKDDRSQVIGEWEIEDSDEPKRTLGPESSYRAAAMARYARTRQIEVDRFATVSLTDDGAYVQGWLFVPREDVASSGQEISRKPPQSVTPIDNSDRKTG